MAKDRVVLCVDDEEDILSLFSDQFSEQGFVVLLANSGSKALEIYQNKKVDAIVSDIRMSDGDGLALARSVRDKDKDIPIFLVTGFYKHSAVNLSLLDELNISELVTKPLDFQNLVNSVSEAINNRFRNK